MRETKWTTISFGQWSFTLLALCGTTMHHWHTSKQRPMVERDWRPGETLGGDHFQSAAVQAEQHSRACSTTAVVTAVLLFSSCSLDVYWFNNYLEPSPRDKDKVLLSNTLPASLNASFYFQETFWTSRHDTNILHYSLVTLRPFPHCTHRDSTVSINSFTS